MDFPEWGSLTGLAGEVSTTFDVLATAAGLGTAGLLVEDLASVSERAERAPAIEVERIVSRRKLCSREKRGCGVGKTKRGKGTKWMVVRPRQKSLRVIADKAYDSDPLRKRLAEAGGSNWSVRTSRIAFGPRRRMVEPCGATGGDGSSNAPTLGWETSAAW